MLLLPTVRVRARRHRDLSAGKTLAGQEFFDAVTAADPTGGQRYQRSC
jgi:hypothetical protein